MLKRYLKFLIKESVDECVQKYFNELGYYLNKIESKIDLISKDIDLKQIDLTENTYKLNMMINEVKGVVTQARGCLNIAKEIKDKK